MQPHQVNRTQQPIKTIALSLLLINHAPWPLQNALMPHALCPMPYALCPVHCVPCLMCHNPLSLTLDPSPWNLTRVMHTLHDIFQFGLEVGSSTRTPAHGLADGWPDGGMVECAGARACVGTGTHGWMELICAAPQQPRTRYGDSKRKSCTW
jgi:hypothetical protein